MEQDKPSSRMIPVEHLDVTEHKMLNIGHHDLRNRLKELEQASNARGAVSGFLSLFLASVASWSTAPTNGWENFWIACTAISAVIFLRSLVIAFKYRKISADSIVNNMLSKYPSVN